MFGSRELPRFKKTHVRNFRFRQGWERPLRFTESHFAAARRRCLESAAVPAAETPERHLLRLGLFRYGTYLPLYHISDGERWRRQTSPIANVKHRIGCLDILDEKHAWVSGYGSKGRNVLYASSHPFQLQCKQSLSESLKFAFPVPASCRSMCHYSTFLDSGESHFSSDMRFPAPGRLWRS